jgi:hypothetical protein
MKRSKKANPSIRMLTGPPPLSSFVRQHDATPSPPMDFYSARLLFMILVADGVGKKRNHCDESVIVFRAKDFDHAFKRALELGRERETDYNNQKGQRVRWALVEVLTLDWVGRRIDGKEVASVLHYRTSKKRVSPGSVFHPEKSKPAQTF